VNWNEIFEQFNQQKILVVGDVMVDSYVWGKVNRISPEAPVPIVNAERRENRLGGAGNVALNLLALGAKPILCSVIGNDADSKTLEALLLKRRMQTDGMVKSSQRITTVKHRILAGSQQLLRIDSETTEPITQNESKLLIERVEKLAKEADAIIFQDYDKGVLTPSTIQKIIQIAQSHKVPTIVDPKKRNFLSYEGSTLFKPNLKELAEGLNINIDGSQLESVKAGMDLLQKEMPTQMGMVTLSQHGVYIKNQESSHHFPAHRREIADVSGAGDTVVSIAALCLASRLPIDRIAQLANLGGGLVCEFLGVVPIDKTRLLAEATLLFP